MLPAALAEFFGHAAEVGRAGIFGVVDAMAEAGDLFLLGEHLADVLDWVGAGFVDGVEEAHGGLVGSAVEWAFEGADGSGDGGVDVGEGGGDDARGEGAGVELVVGVEDEGDVEGAGGGVGGLFAVEHPEEVGGVRESGVGFDDGLALADAIEDGDDHGDLRGEAVGLADVGVVRAVGFVGVVDAEEGDGGAEDLHGRGVCGDAAEEVDDLGVELAGGGEFAGRSRRVRRRWGACRTRGGRWSPRRWSAGRARGCRCRDRRGRRRRRRSSRWRSWWRRCLPGLSVRQRWT